MAPKKERVADEILDFDYKTNGTDVGGFPQNCFGFEADAPVPPRDDPSVVVDETGEVPSLAKIMETCAEFGFIPDPEHPSDPPIDELRLTTDNRPNDTTALLKGKTSPRHLGFHED